MMTDQQKQQITDKLSSLLEIANKRFNKNLKMPTVFYDCDGTRGGYHQTGTLHFNPVLTIQNFDHYLAVTVPHEMAHYIQWHVFPDSLTSKMIYRGYRATFSRRRVHGREWQSIMRLFGIRNPERCHNYDVSDVPLKRVFKKFPVYCSCNVYQVTSKIIVKLQAGRAYTCKLCKGNISLTKPLTSPATVVS